MATAAPEAQTLRRHSALSDMLAAGLPLGAASLACGLAYEAASKLAVGAVSVGALGFVLYETFRPRKIRPAAQVAVSSHGLSVVGVGLSCALIRRSDRPDKVDATSVPNRKSMPPRPAM